VRNILVVDILLDLDIVLVDEVTLFVDGY